MHPDTDFIGKTNGMLPSSLDTSLATSNKGALLITGTDSFTDSMGGDEEKQSSLFPIRPGRMAQPSGHQHGRALALERANARDVVPVKSYVPESPSFAPRFHNAGNVPHLLRKHVYLLTNRRGSRLFPLDRMSRRGCPQRANHQTRLLRQVPNLPE